MFSICQWDTPTLLIFSDNVFGNLVYYSHLTSLILAFFVGLVIYINNRKSLLNKLLFAITLVFSLWSFCDLILWATDKPQFTMFFWSLVILFEHVIYIASVYFLYVFINKKDVSTKLKYFLFTIILPAVLLLPTSFALNAFNFTNCDREAVEGILVYYGYALEIVCALWVFIYGVTAFHKNKDQNERKQILLVTIGTCLFLLSFAFGNIVGSLNVDWTLGQYGLFGLPIFIGFLAYLVSRYHTFNTKVFTAQLTSLLSIILVFSLLFVRKIEHIKVIVIPTVVILSGLSLALIRSVKREIEQRERLEVLTKELGAANEKLKGLDKLKSEFLSLASHQLRTPLTAIKGYASMLFEGSFGKLEPKQEEGAKRIYTSAQGLVNTVEDLLNISKIEQGGMKYEFMPVDLSQVVTDLYNEMKIPAESKKLEFTLDMPENQKFMVNADPVKIKQVLLNLTDNSIKYTKEGFVHLSLKREENVVIFSVSDNGMGISEETRAKLFEKFSRGEGGKTNTGGSGLGLYLAKQITTAHKGDVTIESKGEGQGSTFSVILPALDHFN
ncbi:MAG: ATP-binding protein [Patescibacteria group bacterium]